MADCFCGAEKRPDIFRCEHHRYWRNGVEYTSVSRVISAVYPKKSWDGVDPSVIANARERGERVDKYLTTYIETGSVTPDEIERVDVRERLDCVIEYWNKHLLGLPFKAKQIVYSDKWKIAGETDFLCMADGGIVIDLKNTAQIERSYALQVGAYRSLASVELGGILHVNPRVYKREGGCRFVMTPAECVEWWENAVRWWQSLQAMEAA